MQRRQLLPVATKEQAPVEEEAPRVEVVRPPPTPWKVPLEQGDLRGAARLLSQQMITLIRERTGSRIISTADALEACPDQGEALARFFEDADRLAYAAADPTREEILALEAAYLRLAEEIRGQ